MLLWLPSPAIAQDGGQNESGTEIKGTLEARDDTERTPVEGVTITVGQDGAAIGSSTSDADGNWVVPVPAAGIYQVELEVGTLPDGIAPTDPARMSLSSVEVREGQSKTVRFNLGSGRTTGGSSDLERFQDLVVLGLKLGAIIALAAVGLSMIFSVTGLVNFAHGEMLTFGAVIAFFLHAANSGPGWPLVVAAIPAVALTGVVGGAQELALWRPLRRRRTSTIAMLVISIGLAFAARNTVLVILGGEPTNYDEYRIQTDKISLVGFEFTPKNLFIVLATVVILVAVGGFLRYSRAGVALRAVADNKDLAASSGIDVDRVILNAWILGGALSGLAGVFLGVSETVQWDMGFRVLLLIFAAVVLGGLGTSFGAAIGAFIIGLAVEVSTFWIAVELKNAVALAILVIMLLWRPQGLLGTRERIG